MKITWAVRGLATVACTISCLLAGGCSPEEASQALKDAETSAEDAVETIKEDAEKVIKEGGEIAGDLGEKAMSFLEPLKEKFGDLESLKETPAELKTAVSDLIASIETKAEGLQLPESISSGLTAIKEKLVALKEYLEGEADQAKIAEHLQEIKEMVESKLGLSGN